MPKKYNILNDKATIKRILEEIKEFCDGYKGCTYCPFFDSALDNCRLEVNNGARLITPFEYLEEDD